MSVAPAGPRVIQLRRTKGWRKPEGAVVVARPSRWGNPFTIGGCIEAGFADDPERARKVCAAAFAHWLRYNDGEWWQGPECDQRHAWMTAHLPALAGKTLACWCPQPGPCHAHALAELANEDGP